MSPKSKCSLPIHKLPNKMRKFYKNKFSLLRSYMKSRVQMVFTWYAHVKTHEKKPFYLLVL